MSIRGTPEIRQLPRTPPGYQASLPSTSSINATRPSVSVRNLFASSESCVIQGWWPDSEGPSMWTKKNRGRYDRNMLRYPSDLTDDEWAHVEPLIPLGERGVNK